MCRCEPIQKHSKNQKIFENAKPMLFNTEMVRAILENRKTVTRRVVKLKYSNTHLEMKTDKYGKRLVELQNEEPGVTTVKNPDGSTTRKLLACIEKKPPYRPGDILYVRETFCKYCLNEISRKGHSDYCYKASVTSPVYGCIDHYSGGTACTWRPSIHMPREAARIFLRVTDVQVERLQDITEDGAIKEGCTAHGGNLALDEFEAVWHSTLKLADRSLYGWDANPWVWVIEFERIGREEAIK